MGGGGRARHPPSPHPCTSAMNLLSWTLHLQSPLATLKTLHPLLTTPLQLSPPWLRLLRRTPRQLNPHRNFFRRAPRPARGWDRANAKHPPTPVPLKGLGRGQKTDLQFELSSQEFPRGLARGQPPPVTPPPQSPRNTLLPLPWPISSI